ncbi:MAG: ribonuclease HII [Pseudomonadota bacterium]
MVRAQPTFTFETDAIAHGATSVAGVDEVGRGPLAGPVTAAAVVLDPEQIPPGLTDSKQLSATARADIAEKLHRSARVSIAHASVAEIDRLNIQAASHLAMLRALEGLHPAPDFALIDGNRLPGELPCPAMGIVKGDCKSLSISAASIVAKVCRDQIMVDLAQQYPAYGWEQNRGYPTPQHLAVLKSHGATPHHRRTFAPVHKILYQEKSLTP